MQLINLQEYSPVDKKYGDCVYLLDEEGLDWYDSLPLFTKKYKFSIDPVTGQILGMSSEVNNLWPARLSVIELDNYPEGCVPNGSWAFNGIDIVPYTPPVKDLVSNKKKTTK